MKSLLLLASDWPYQQSIFYAYIMPSKKSANKAAGGGTKKKDDKGPVVVPDGSDKTAVEQKDKKGSVVLPDGSDGSDKKVKLRSGTAPKMSAHEETDAALARKLQRQSFQGRSESDDSSVLSGAGSKKTPRGKGTAKKKGDSGKSDKEGSGSSSNSGFSSGGGGKDSGEKTNYMKTDTKKN